MADGSSVRWGASSTTVQRPRGRLEATTCPTATVRVAESSRAGTPALSKRTRGRSGRLVSLAPAALAAAQGRQSGEARGWSWARRPHDRCRLWRSCRYRRPGLVLTDTLVDDGGDWFGDHELAVVVIHRDDDDVTVRSDGAVGGHGVVCGWAWVCPRSPGDLSLIHISEPTRPY